jgi:uncharacterized protein YqjF (DUF2071 family)
MQAEPSARSFLTARWEWLVMLNYAVDPAILAGRVPPGTELDTWNGNCLVSMVGFLFLDTRLLGLPVPFHRRFEEVNLRFYVRRATGGELRRGVVFVKEIVPMPAIAWTARLAYNENYVALPMAHHLDVSGPEKTVAYTWQYAGQTNRLALRTHGPAYLPEPDSQESFISEHYFGYARQRDGSTLEYRVEHPQWRVWQGQVAQFDCAVAQLYGPEFVEALHQPPHSLFLAEGSAVTVRGGQPLK